MTALLPWGEKTGHGTALWDTGADVTTLGRHFADRLEIVPMMPTDANGDPVTTANMRFLGDATVRLRIGDIVIPYKTVKVMDFDPDGIHQAAGRDLPDMLIGMDIIARGRLTVDSTSGETVLTFELP